AGQLTLSATISLTWRAHSSMLRRISGVQAHTATWRSLGSTIE
ncbi:MAG: hypothetical protein K0R33_1035, partial [Mycobacterium sp.]|nr:hypothetical protein [Mycobacterium sp.]